jgi:hypothetical protein
MRKTFFIYIGLFMLFLAACGQSTMKEDFVIESSIQAITNTYASGTHLFESLSELLAFKADHGLNELDIEGYDDAFFEEASLIIIVFDEEESVMYVEEVMHTKDGLEIAMIRTTEPLGNKTCFLLISSSRQHMLTPDLVSLRIRDAIMTSGQVSFKYDSYNSEVDFAFEDWEHMSSFENNLHIFNSTNSFDKFCITYPHMLPADTSTFDSDFFEDHTLLIIQLWFGAHYYNSVIVESVLIQNHQISATIKLPNFLGERVRTIYSFWIVIDKNENITSLTHHVT